MSCWALGVWIFVTVQGDPHHTLYDPGSLRAEGCGPGPGSAPHLFTSDQRPRPRSHTASRGSREMLCLAGSADSKLDKNQ